MSAAMAAEQPAEQVDRALDEAPPSMFHLKTAVTAGMGFLTHVGISGVIEDELRHICDLFGDG